MDRTSVDSHPAAAASSRRTTGSGVVFGVGLAAFVDETVFHQLLHWHHFYDRSTPAAGLVSDGVFHAFGWFAVVAALFLLVDVGRRGVLRWRRWIGALLLGAGGFQLYDGVIQHKLMRLHQIRYHVDVVPYDIAWNVAAVVMIIIGGVVLVHSSRRAGHARA